MYINVRRTLQTLRQTHTHYLRQHRNLLYPNQPPFFQILHHIMTRPFRHLLTTPATSTPPPPPLEQVHAEFVIIIAALLCALISFLGVLAITRFARLYNNYSSHDQQPPANKELKKNALNSLSTQPYSSEFVQMDCAICLAEFAQSVYSICKLATK